MSITDPSTSVQAVKYTYEPYRVSVEEYVPCVAKLPQPPASHTSRGKSMSMMGDDSGLMGLAPHEEKEHDETHE